MIAHLICLALIFFLLFFTSLPILPRSSFFSLPPPCSSNFLEDVCPSDRLVGLRVTFCPISDDGWHGMFVIKPIVYPPRTWSIYLFFTPDSSISNGDNINMNSANQHIRGARENGIINQLQWVIMNVRKEIENNRTVEFIKIIFLIKYKKIDNIQFDFNKAKQANFIIISLLYWISNIYCTLLVWIYYSITDM